MAIIINGGKAVRVQFGDTLSEIAKFYGGGASYKQLAAINDIPNPDKIYVGQTIELTKTETSSTPKKTSSPKAIVKQCGLQSNADGKMFATWTWSKPASETEGFKVLWTYDTGQGIWFEGRNTTVPADEDSYDLSKMDEYNLPANAKQVKFKVKPISKKKDSKSESTYWTAAWSNEWTHTVDEEPPEKPSAPTVTIDKYQLTAVLDNLDEEVTHIKFQVVKDNSSNPFNTSKNIAVTSRHASYSCKIDPGGEYKVRCQAIKGSLTSEWSDYSSNQGTIPSVPSSDINCWAISETSVRLEWKAVSIAKTYDIEYATKKEYFEGSDQVNIKSNVTPDITSTNPPMARYTISGLDSGNSYFFRIRAVNDKGDSAWTSLAGPVAIGKDPAAPTTWSSTTTAISGEPLTLYWVHNTEDGSSQVSAELELTIDGAVVSPNITIKNTTDEELKDKTSSCVIDTQNSCVRWTEDSGTKEVYLGVSFVEGSVIKWRVRTMGVTNKYGDWSTQRTIDIYAPVTLELHMLDRVTTNDNGSITLGNVIGTLHSFPFYIYGLPGVSKQVPIGYHLTITSNEIYETVDNVGNEKTVNEGEAVYSKYFDISDSLLVEFSANNVDLENNISYTVTCTVSMDSGLTAEDSLDFTVSWTEAEYQPNAEIGVDPETMSAYIRPYCENGELVYYRVDFVRGVYTRTDEVLEYVWGEPVPGATVSSGERVYKGVSGDGVDVYYCAVEEKTEITDILMSVYRREFDGSFTELATSLDVTKHTTVTDPHPALDFARYRIVAVDKKTGAVSYYDPPGYPVGGTAVIIQWAEDWTTFETTEDATLAQPPWAGSLLKLPYNIDVSDNPKPDVALIEYIGRSHPISYYGTQLGHTATWNVEIEKDDEETLYGLRRLARWMGDVYVREPSGSGYWANITVSFSQKHRALTIPVTLEIARVEGGM